MLSTSHRNKGCSIRFLCKFYCFVFEIQIFSCKILMPCFVMIFYKDSELSVEVSVFPLDWICLGVIDRRKTLLNSKAEINCMPLSHFNRRGRPYRRNILSINILAQASAVSSWSGNISTQRLASHSRQFVPMDQISQLPKHRIYVCCS